MLNNTLSTNDIHTIANYNSNYVKREKPGLATDLFVDLCQLIKVVF